jgi:hypothetical protein
MDDPIQTQKEQLNRLMGQVDTPFEIDQASIVDAEGVSLQNAYATHGQFQRRLPQHVSSVSIQATWDVFDWSTKRKQVEIKRDAETQAAPELKDARAFQSSSIRGDDARVLRSEAERLKGF